MENKHSGCFVCGSMAHPVLFSRTVVGYAKAGSVAVCPPCDALSDSALNLKVQKIQAATAELMARAREAL